MCELCNCYSQTQQAAMNDVLLHKHLSALNQYARLASVTYNAFGAGFGLQNAYVPPAVARLRKAQEIAAGFALAGRKCR